MGLSHKKDSRSEKGVGKSGSCPGQNDKSQRYSTTKVPFLVMGHV